MIVRRWRACTKSMEVFPKKIMDEQKKESGSSTIAGVYTAVYTFSGLEKRRLTGEKREFLVKLFVTLFMLPAFSMNSTKQFDLP